MTNFPEGQAAQWTSGVPLAALIVDRHHTVLNCTPAMSELLRRPLSPGSVAEGLIELPPGVPLPAEVNLHGPRGPLPCRATALGGTPPTTLLTPLHQLTSTVLDVLPLDVAVLDARGHYLYVNPAAIRNPEVRAGILGLTDEEYMQWRGHPPERARARAEHFRQSAATGQQVRFSEHYPGPPATDLQRTYLPVLTPQGELQLMLGFGEDHTMDRQLAEQRRLLQTMVDTSVDPLLVVNARPGPAHQQVEYANPAMLELLRHHGLDSLPDVPVPQWPMAQGNSTNILTLLGCLESLPVGSTFRDTLFLPEAQQWLEVYVNSILGPDGARSHWAVSLRDITRQRAAEVWRDRMDTTHRLALAGAPLPQSLAPLLAEADPWGTGWQIGAVVASEPPLVIGALPESLKRDLLNTPPGSLDVHWHELDPVRQGHAVVTADLNVAPPEAVHDLIRRCAHSLIELPLYGRDGQLLGALMALHHAPHAWTGPVVEHFTQLAMTAGILIEQHLNQDRLERLAYRDPLTGLLNRSALADWTDAALNRGAPLALGLMDLNRFRFLNDGFGHEVGDQLLADLGRRLRQMAERRGVQALARMGGDEFGLLVRPEQMQAVLDDLHAIFQQPFEARGNPLLLEATVGWSVTPGADDAQTMLQQADSALYEAKRTQVFSHVFEPAPQPRIATVTLESALRESLRDGHFRMVYQPQIQLDTCMLVGAEALLRWTHPTLGPIPPDQFIPVAELAGLMPRLGEWVLNAACHEAAKWANPHLSVSVNVSSRQLVDATFDDRVRQALAQSGLHPSRLVIEVTESGLIENPARAREVLQELRARGVRVSMDDFGTGYSSLFSLRSLPVDELKIDRAFVRDLGQDTQAARESQAIVMASVLMARSLGIELLAEGVETEEQAQVLREVGCDLAQGWLYARPLERDAFDTFERSWSRRLTAPRAPWGPLGPEHAKPPV